MKRREFIHTTTATVAALVAQGHLPLLAAQEKRMGRSRNNAPTGPQNCFSDPSAIEPLTGHLPRVAPASGKAMTGIFSASYSLVEYHGGGARSKNSLGGTMDVSFSRGRCRTEETRTGQTKTTVKTALQFSDKMNTTSRWRLTSLVDGRNDLTFIEQGTCNRKAMAVKTSSWTQERETEHPLIARWALLPLLASGKLKQQPLIFDMLDDSTLRPNQTLRYEGELEVPIKGGDVRLDSYVQTGQGIVPTHYLVDEGGRVQFITMTTVNWALTGMRA